MKAGLATLLTAASAFGWAGAPTTLEHLLSAEQSYFRAVRNISFSFEETVIRTGDPIRKVSYPHTNTGKFVLEGAKFFSEHQFHAPIGIQTSRHAFDGITFMHMEEESREIFFGTKADSHDYIKHMNPFLLPHTFALGGSYPSFPLFADPATWDPARFEDAALSQERTDSGNLVHLDFHPKGAKTGLRKRVSFSREFGYFPIRTYTTEPGDLGKLYVGFELNVEGTARIDAGSSRTLSVPTRIRMIGRNSMGTVTNETVYKIPANDIKVNQRQAPDTFTLPRDVAGYVLENRDNGEILTTGPRLLEWKKLMTDENYGARLRGEEP